MAESRCPAKKLRCAIYTRKSSEEGLEQAFNSLDAQREACAAFILSQKHEGWTVLPTLYDDGGFSGGTMDRPALKLLLSDIAEGRVDVVVVYKIDRLTRSLFDFAKIVEAFEAKGVSFVSITQQFNTSTSMGRLTLNVLLSFASLNENSPASAYATRLRPRRRRACGWAVCRRLGMTSKIESSWSMTTRRVPSSLSSAVTPHSNQCVLSRPNSKKQESGVSGGPIQTAPLAEGRSSRAAPYISCSKTASIVVRSPTKVARIWENTRRS
jgi:predicted site-specific integrase-resolvase